jgi:glycosyltransferase involved in cell wall biosynthesis
MSRVLVYHPNLSGQLGGAEKVALESAAGLRKEGYEVDLVIDEGKEILENDIFSASPDIEVYRPDPEIRKIKQSRAILLQDLIQQKGIKNEILELENNYDVIFLSSDLHVGGSTDSPCIQYIHGKPPNMDSESQFKQLYYSALRRYGDYQLFNSDLNLFNSKFTRDLWDANGRVVYPPVSSSFNYKRFENKSDRIVLAGRISPDKNHFDAIRIAEMVSKKLVIIGISEDEDYLDDLKSYGSSRNVEILTDVNYENFREVIENSRYALNTKPKENFGITVAEYLKSGTIPFVRESGGQREIVGMERLTFSSIKEATDLIDNLDNSTGAEIQEKLRKRKSKFSTEKFRTSIINSVERVRN